MAHRGAPKIATENTLASFEAALRLGVDAIELDVHLTKDRRLAVHHDEELGRTVDGAGAIADLTLRDLKRFSIRGARPSERVPSLEEALDLCRGRCHLAVEAKLDFPQAREFARVLGKTLRRVLPKHARQDATVISFCHSVIGHVRSGFPEIPAGPSFDKKHPPAAALHFDPSVVVAAHEIVDASWIAPFRERGIPVWVYTVNERKEWNRLAKLGAAAVITDRPDLFVSQRSPAKWRAPYR